MAGFTIPANPPVAQVTDLGGTADRLLYVNSAGAVAEIGLGSAGQVLTSTGASSAPSFQAAGGGESVIPLILALGG